MLKQSLAISIALFLAACSGSAKNPEAARGGTTPEEPNLTSCEDDRLSAELERLHSLAVAEDQLPTRVRSEYTDVLDGLRAPGTAEDGAFSVAAPPFTPQIVPVVHHAPRFQGEETPRVIHWERSGLGKPGDGAFERELIATANGTEVVTLALWQGMEGPELDQLLRVLERSGVRSVNLLGRQDLPRLESFSPPQRAATLYAKMREPHASALAARVRATHELERLVLESSGGDIPIPARISTPGQSLEEQSRAYINFLRTAYHRSDCTLEANDLVWLYRVRFAAAPLAVVQLDLRDLETSSRTDTLQEIAGRAAVRR